MCGIAGLVSLESGYRVPPDLSRILLDSMRHRGPDASGLWQQQDARALLLHHRLSIQDLTPTGAQPMHSHDNGLTIVLNGEIYNKEDLYPLVPDYPFRGTSDTEVVLALYEKYGTDMPRLLRGMFAFAIWDERRQALFLARDPYGIKPLYLTETAEGFWFASEVKTLLHVPGVDLAPNPAGHAGFFLWGSVPEPHTLYRGIRSLRSGHTLWLQRGQRPVETQFASIAAALADGAETTPQTSLGEALLNSVRAHFLSDVPVSVFLSAGLDSSSILGMAAAALPAASLNCLTLGFDVLAGTPHDETRESAQTASHYSVPQQIQIIHWSDFLDENRKFLLAMDQPTIDGVNTYFIARMARAAGCKVALSGIGGDELFAGYPSFHQIPRMLSLAGKLRVSKKLGAVLRRWTAPLADRLTSPKYAGALEYGTTLEDAYLLRRALYMPWELSEVLDQELAAAGLEVLADSADSQSLSKN